MSVEFWIGVGVIAGIYAIFVLGLQINVGFTGLLNLGQAGFMSIGAYAMGMLVVDAGWSLWAAMPVAIAIAVTAGLLVGLPSLRLRADYFAIATIAFAEIVRYTFQNAGFAGGNQGIIGYDAEWRALAAWLLHQLAHLGLGGITQLPLFLAVWFCFGLCLMVLRLLAASPWGRVLRAIREDEDAAAALGKNVLAVARDRRGARGDRGVLSGAQRDLSLPQRVRSDFHVSRLCRARAGRLCQLWRRRARRGSAVEPHGGPALPASADQRWTAGLAPLRADRARSHPPEHAAPTRSARTEG
jgi:hypothetical protein